MNTSQRQLLLVSSAFVLSTNIFAQDFKARVVEQGSSTPLQGITILQGDKVIAVSDKQGFFAISEGKLQQPYKITLRGVGYEQRLVTLDTRAQGQTFILRPSMNFIDELVVTTTRKERSIKDEPVITHIFSAKQIEKLAPTSIRDVLTSVIPGVQFEEQRGGSGSTQTIRIQGLGGSYIMFLLDGEPLSSKNGENFMSPRGGQIDFSRIDVNNIERIEYLPSGGSILYGSNSIGGVVNIISKKAKEPLTLRLGTRLTLPEEQRYEGNVGIKRGKLDTHLSLTHQRRNAYSLYEGVAYNNFGQVLKDATGLADSIISIESPKSQSWIANLNTNYQANDKLRLRGGVNFSSNILYLRNETRERRTNSYDNYALGTRLGGQYQIAQGHTLDLSTSLEYAKREIDIYDKGSKKSSLTPDYSNTLFVARLNYTLEHSPQHTTLAGVENTYEHGKSQWLEQANGHISNTTTAYAQHDAKFFAGKTLISYGLRYDHNNTFGGALLHRASLMQKLGPIDLRFLYSESFRAPSFVERFAKVDDPMGRGTMLGNPDLKPERSRRYTVQAGYNTRNLSLSASGFKADIENLIENRNESDASGTLVMRRYNTDKHISYLGAELMARAQFTFGTYLQTSYSYTHSVSRSVVDKDGNRYNTSLVRPHSLNLMLGHTWGAKHYTLDLNLSGRITSDVTYYQGTTQTIPAGVKTILIPNTQTGGTTTYYERKEDAYSNFRFSSSLKLYNTYTLQLGVDNLLDYKPSVTNYSSAFTMGRRFFIALYIDVNQLWRKSKK